MRSAITQNFSGSKTPERLPIILSLEEVRRLIDAATNLLHRALLMTLYSTGMRRANSPDSRSPTSRAREW